MTHGRVAQYAFVYREKSRPLQYAVGETSFDAEGLTSWVQLSLTSTSYFHVSPTARCCRVRWFSETPLKPFNTSFISKPCY